MLARHIRGEIDRQARQAGDFLIVTCKKHRLSVYAAALARYGIAHEVTGGTALNEVSELGLLVTLVRAALEPDNPVAVVAALRSELFGVSDPELYAYRRAGGRFDFRAEATGTMGEAFEVLRRCADWLSALAPVIAVERIAGEIGLLAVAAADGEIAAGSLGKAMELLRSMPAELLTATDCVTQLERLVEHQPAHDGASMLPPKASAVRVMNLHKVKGLQAPVVFLADPSGESEHDVRLHVDRRQARVTGALALYGIAGQYGPGPLLAHPGNWEELAAREEQFQEAEYDRLLYVAVTRARDQLIVSQRAKPSDKNPWEPLRPALAGQNVLPDPGAQSAPVQEPAEVDVPAVAAARLALEGRWELARTASYAIRTAKPVAFGATPHAARGDGDGARWGSVIHLLLQSAMREPEAELEALAVSALRDADVEVARSGEAVAVVRKVAASKIWQRAREARQCLTEVPFIMAGKDGVVRGVIDLAFEEADGWVLVDYKTDMAGIEKLLEKARWLYRY